MADCPKGAELEVDDRKCQWRDSCVEIKTEEGIDNYSEMCVCAHNAHMAEAAEWSV